MARSSPHNTASRLRCALLTGSALGAIALCGPASANPYDGQFVGGGGTMQGCNGSSTCWIDLNKGRVIIDWRSFDIGSFDKTTFQFDQNDWIVLNRVRDGSAKIEGTLQGCLDPKCATFGGNIWIYAADGIVIGQGASINTGGLLLTTSPMTEASTMNFLHGGNQFDFGNSNPDAGIKVEYGARITGHGGTVALISQQITTEAGSTIEVKQGQGGGTSSVLYGAASSYRVKFADEGGDFDLVDFNVPADSVGSSARAPLNIGGRTISAGNIYVAAVVNPAQTAGAIINVSGEMTANAVSSRGGNIVLSANGGIVNRAAAQSTGGPVDVRISGAINADNMVQIKSSGAIYAPGTISADTLTGSSVGGATFSGANAVKSLGDFTNTAGGDFSLRDTRSLDVAGTLDNAAGDTTLRVDTGDLTIGGKISTNTLTTVARNGSIRENSDAIIVADTLTGSSSGGARFVGSNLIAKLGAFENSRSGDFTLVDGRALTVAGPLTNRAGNIKLSTTSGDLTIDASIDAGQHILALESAGSIAEGTGGGIIAGTLTGTSMDDARFGGDGNMIGTLAGFRSGGDFTLSDGRTLKITDMLRANDVSFDVKGNIDARGGIIIADSLTGSATGWANFGNDANTVGALDGFSTGSGFTFFNSGRLNVTGDVDAGTGNLSLKTLSGDLILDANLIAGQATGSQTVSLIAEQGAITQKSGTITAGILKGRSGTATVLDGKNSVGALDGFSAGSGFSFVNSGRLDVTGDVDAGTGNLALKTLSGDLILDANLIAGQATGSQTVSLISEYGAITQEDGTITAGILKGRSGTATRLDHANSVGVLDGFSAGSGFTFVDSGKLTVTGDINAGSGNLMLETLSGDLVLDASLIAGAASGSQSVSLVSATGAIRQDGGTITAGILTGLSGTATTLDRDNEIGTLSSFASGGDFSLQDDTTLVIAGTLAAHGVTLDVDGDIDASGGIIKAGSLTGRTTGRADFGNAANSVGVLNGFSAGSGFTFVNSGQLTVAGDIDAGGGNLALWTHAGDLILEASLKAGPASASQIVTLVSEKGAITQNKGTITAGILTGQSGTTTKLDGANLVRTLNGFKAESGFVFSDARGLAVTGDIDAGTGDLMLATSSGDLILDASLIAGAMSGSQTVSLDAAGAIVQGHGTITAGLLTGRSGAATTLDATNSVGVLNGFSAGSDFTFYNAGQLKVAGDIEAGGDLTLKTYSGDLMLAANLTAGSESDPHTIMLNSAGDITQKGGKVEAEDVTFNAAGSIYLYANDDPKLPNIKADIVALHAAHNILMGNEQFITDARDLSEAALATYLNNQARYNPLKNDAVFVTAHQLQLDAPGRIIQQNTGNSIDAPGGIVIDHGDSDSDPAILISGRPDTVDLWGALTENGAKIPVRQVASSSAIQFGDDDTRRKNSYRVNGCIVQQTVACTVVQFNFDNIEPARLTDELQVKASNDDDEDTSEDDPTITGSGNPEIWGE